MVYKIPAWARKMPYSAGIFPPVLSQTFFGTSEKAGDGWDFPEDVFPFATYLRPGHRGPRPREIPVPMIIYIVMAVCFFFSEPSLVC